MIYVESLIEEAKRSLEGTEWQVNDLIEKLPKELNPKLIDIDGYVGI